MATTEDRLRLLENTKAEIKQAIIDKGQNVQDTDPFSKYPEYIANISGGGSSDVESVTITNKASLENISMPTNGTYVDYPLDVTVSPSSAPQITQVLLSNPQVARILDNGNGTWSLRVVSGGATTVTVTDYTGNVRDSFTMNVTVPVLDISFPYANIGVEAGSTRQLQVNFKPSLTTQKELTWSSTNPEITVSPTGVISGNTTAYGDVSAYSPVLDKTITVHVNVVETAGLVGWQELAAQVRLGNKPKAIGDIITDKWTNLKTGTEYDFQWRVVHYYDDVEKEDGTRSQGMALQAVNSLPDAFYFENEQKVEATEDTAQEGVYYYGWTSGSNYTPLNLQTGDVIQKELYTAVYKSGIDFKTSSNFNQALNAGLNYWKESAARQALNSESDQAGFGFMPQHISDTNKNSTNYGFLAGCTPEFVSALTPVAITTSLNTPLWGSGATDTTYDRIFLPSRENMAYSTSNIEGGRWDYWTAHNTNADKVIIPLGSTSGQYTWLRSATLSTVNSEYFVSSYGSINSYSAGNYQYRLVPACVIC